MTGRSRQTAPRRAGSKRQKAPGVWELRATQADGARISRTIHGSESDAEAALVQLLKELAGGITPAPKSLTLGKHLQNWLAESAIHRVDDGTYRAYALTVTQHILPHPIARMPLVMVRPQDIQRWINQQAASHLAPSTVRVQRTHLHTGLEWAVACGIIERNPVDHTHAPEVTYNRVQPISADEAQAILAAFDGDRLAALVRVAISCGLRRGEQLGLRWSEIDLERGIIHITSQIRIQHNRIVRTPTKTRRGRSIEIPPQLVAVLRAHKARQDAERAKARTWADPDVVFANTRGGPLHPNWVTAWFTRTLRDNDLPPRRLHDLRHACATLLIAQGVHPRVIMEILGHASVTTTMNIYGHVIPAASRTALEGLAAAITAPPSHENPTNPLHTPLQSQSRHIRQGWQIIEGNREKRAPDAQVGNKKDVVI